LGEGLQAESSDERLVSHTWGVDNRNFEVACRGNRSGRIVKGCNTNCFIVPFDCFKTIVVIVSSGIKLLIKPNVSSVTVNLSDSTSILRPVNSVFFHIRISSNLSLTLEHGNGSVDSWAHPMVQEGSDFGVNINVTLSKISSVNILGEIGIKTGNQIPLGVLFCNSTSEPLE